MKPKCDNNSELYILLQYFAVTCIIFIYFPYELLGIAQRASCFKIIYQMINNATNIIAYLLGTDPQV